MSFEVVGWSEEDNEAGAYEAKLAVPDPLVTTSLDLLYVPMKYNQLIGAYAACGGTEEGAAYLQSPSLRRVALLDIVPTQEGILPNGDESVRLFPDNPILLDGGEGLELFVNSTPGANEVHSGIVWLADAPITPVKGKIFQVLFTTTITEKVSEWVNGAITFRQTLPVGVYQIVGAAMWGTSGVAFRFNLIGVAHRPGFTTWTSEAHHGNFYQRDGKLGVWAEFHSLTPPSIDWLACATAGIAQTGVMDVIRLG